MEGLGGGTVFPFGPAAFHGYHLLPECDQPLISSRCTACCENRWARGKRARFPSSPFWTSSSIPRPWSIVEGEIIIELKAVQHLLSIHETQLVNYLTATHKDHGLLINFGGDRIEIKRKYREYKTLIIFYDVSIERYFLKCFWT